MRIFIADELKSAYRLNNGVLEYAHIKDNVFDTETFDYVEPELIGDEIVKFNGRDMEFNEVYRMIENILNKSERKS